MPFAEKSGRPWRHRSSRRPLFGAMVAFLFLQALIIACSQRVGVTETPAAQDVVDRVPTATPVPSTAPLPSPSVVAVTVATEAVDQEAVETPVVHAPPDLGFLAAALEESLLGFDGLASYYVEDLRGGQAAVHNGDVAISGTSIVKIPILLQAYRVLDEPPDAAQTRLITETATLSGNYTANLLLEMIAGRPDPYAGARQVTETMRRLGFYNTFIAVPYDLEPDPRYLPTYSTPANQNTEISTNPDSSMQTTVSDMGRLLAMIYDCSGGAGYLVETFGDALTARECRDMIDVMSANDIDAFIEEGVPADTPVAHKHGWVGDTHGDAAIVLAPEWPYVLVIALYQPGWLEWADSTVQIAEMSRRAYRHFTDSGAYPSDVLHNTPPTLSAPAPTPDLPAAYVTNTDGAGLVLRQSPGGTEVIIVPESSLVFLLDSAPEQQGGRTWRNVRLLDDVRGWVVADFLEIQ